MTVTDTQQPVRLPVATSPWSRLYRGQTAIDFIGLRKVGFAISATLIVVTLLSLTTRGLNLGIDFEGGVSWDVPVTETFDIETAEQVLEANGLDPSNARIQERSSESGSLIKVQVQDQEPEVVAGLRSDFADAAGLEENDISVAAVSSSWGRDITEQAVRALIIFLVLVSLFISIRFEWRMAIGALVAMAHDVVISVGIYSLFGFVVTPATVIAFLTILGYSLYDTIVVFDRVRENEAKFAARHMPYSDIVNVSMNQVLMRSLNTSLSSIIPVLSLLVIGSGILGATTLSEFAIALLVGMITGAYSSIFVAAPLLALLKGRSPQWANDRPRAVGEDLRQLVVGGTPPGRRTRARSRDRGRDTDDAVDDELPPDDGDTGSDEPVPAKPKPAVAADKVLTHPPRPRKKKRR